MGEQSIQRRLVAIVAADVAGYTRLMEKDEDGTLAAWQTVRAETIDPAIADHSGRIFKYTGDGFLAEFPTVQEAVRCAVTLQEELVGAPLEFRMGVNIGDIMDDGEDIYGDGVNVAARLEATADPGGICVSADVYSQVRRRFDYTFEDMGEQEMKHISTPVHVFKVILDHLQESAPPPLPDQPSIAVLPFDNLSGDAEQEYFSDGMAEDIITDLSKIEGLLVIARNSSFTFRGQAIGIKEIGQRLGVRYILEGSVRKAGNRVRINAQLIDVPTDSHVWADRYDGELEEIFELQDEITAKIVSALKINLTAKLRGGPDSPPPSDAETYDLFLRGRRSFYTLSPEGIRAAQAQLEKVLDRDKNFAPAYALLSYISFVEWNFVHSIDDSVLMKGLALAEKSVKLDPSSGLAQKSLGWVLAFLRKYDESIACFEKALAATPNDAEILAYYGETLNYADQPELGLEMIERGIRLDPLGPPNWDFHRGHSYYKLRRYDEAIAAIRQSISRGPHFPVTYLFLAVIYSELDRLAEAKEMAAKAHDLAPNYSLATIRRVIPHKSQTEIDRFQIGLKKAGMPEN
jgi:TolB-like protein/Tfp pilus assembly protein PilF